MGDKWTIFLQGEYMSEVHHIRPLGKHDGADIIENMIVVCPNHHAMFDRGAITISLFTTMNTIELTTKNY